MLGFRGCRLGIVYPEITEMQARAIFEAAAEVQKEGIKVKPEIMIPLVGFQKELRLQIEVVHRVAPKRAEGKEDKAQLSGRHDDRNPARRARPPTKSPKNAEFFSFGTNDLTQTCLGMSRDDSGVPAALPGTGNRQEKSVRHASTRPASASSMQDRRRTGPQDPARHQAGHLRRTRRRP